MYEYDADELLSYCENECGFVFDGNEEDFVDKDGVSRMHTSKRINGVSTKVFAIYLPEDKNSIAPLN